MDLGNPLPGAPTELDPSTPPTPEATSPPPPEPDEHYDKNLFSITEEDLNEYAKMVAVMQSLVSLGNVDEEYVGGGETAPPFELLNRSSNSDDPTHFVLDGATLRLPNVGPRDSIATKVEALRVFLEQELGETLFLKAYKRIENIREEDDEDGAVMDILKILPEQKMGFLSLIQQLIVCEDTLNVQTA